MFGGQQIGIDHVPELSRKVHESKGLGSGCVVEACSQDVDDRGPDGS